MKGRANQTRFTIWIIFVIFFGLLLTACNSTAQPNNPSPTTLRIYASLALSGSGKNANQSLINAMQFALDNASAGTGVVGGFKIEFVPLDNSAADTGTPSTEKEVANANKAADDPDAVLYLGPLSTATAQVSIPILNKAGIAMISPGTTYPGLTKSVPSITEPDEPNKYYPTGVRNYFRLLPTDELQGRADASFTQSKLEANTVFIVDDNNVYGKGLAKAYTDNTRKYAIKVLGHESLPNAENDYDAIVSKIKNVNPEAIFYAGSSRPAATLLTKIRAANITTPFLSGSSIQDDVFLQTAGDKANGVYSSIGGTDSSGLPPKGEAFLKAYKAKFGDTLSSTTIYGYDAMSAALSAVKQAGKKDRAVILKAVSSLNNFDGATGKWSFNQDGDVNLTIFSFYVVKNKKWFFDSIADTNTTGKQATNPVADTTTTPLASVAAPSLNQTPTPLASSGAAPNPAATSNGAVSPSPSPIVSPTPGQRVDAASQLPPPFKLYRLADLPVAVYIPPLTNAAAKSPQVLIVLHGMFSNGGTFGKDLLPFAQEHQLILIAPTLNYNVNFLNPEVVADEDTRLTAQLNEVVEQLSQTANLIPQEKFLLFGFSRGAQLAHHYAMLYPTRVQAITVLSAGAYTLPVTELNNQPLRFPYGLYDLSNYVKHDFDQSNFIKIPFNVQVGALDNDAKQVSRAWDKYIGTNRVTRGENFYRSLEEIGVKARFTIVPKTAHEVNLAQLQISEEFLRSFLLT